MDSKRKWSKLLNGPVSKPELTAKEKLDLALSKYKKKPAEFVVTIRKTK